MLASWSQHLFSVAEVFDDRSKVVSPGLFPKGITIDQALGGRSEIRNKGIVRIFKEAKFTFHREQDAKQDATDLEEKIINYIRENESVNIRIVMELLGLSKSRTNTIIKGLIESSCVIQ